MSMCNIEFRSLNCVSEERRNYISNGLIQIYMLSTGHLPHIQKLSPYNLVCDKICIIISQTFAGVPQDSSRKLVHERLPTHLSHDSDGRLSGCLGDAVLHQVEHVLVVEQPDEMEGAETSGTTQGQVPDHHGAGGGERGRRQSERNYINTAPMSFNLPTPHAANHLNSSAWKYYHTLVKMHTVYIQVTAKIKETQT